jgi:hypothetical protein
MGKHAYANRLGTTYGERTQISHGPARHRKHKVRRDWTKPAALSVIISALMSMGPTINLSGINLLQ